MHRHADRITVVHFLTALQICLCNQPLEVRVDPLRFFGACSILSLAMLTTANTPLVIVESTPAVGPSPYRHATGAERRIDDARALAWRPAR
jgi:hypothetical protein